MAVIVAVPAAFSQPMMGREMAEQLKLTDQQISQMQALRIQHEKDMIKLRSDLALARVELKEVMMQTKIDENAAFSKQDRISSIKGDMAKAKLQHMLSARKILTDDQLAQWRKMRPEMGRRGKRGFKGCGGMGPMGPGMMGHGPGMMMEGGQGKMEHGQRMKKMEGKKK
jgi:Spy/CpxP family protein refolding chaperone